MTEKGADHALALGHGNWSLWRDGLLRSAGFPVEGLVRFTETACATAADSYIAGQVSLREFESAFASARARNSHEIARIASDELFREAVTWQNRPALITLTKLTEPGQERAPNRRQRQRQRMLARYWQRYCGKADSVGFFGPLCWTTIDDSRPDTIVRPGRDLVRDRRVYFEYWPLAALAKSLETEPSIRPWLAPALRPHLVMNGREVIDPFRPPLPVTAVQASVLSRCQGRAPAWQIAREAVADPACELRSPEDVYLLLDMMAERGIITWDFDLPVSFGAERSLRDAVARIGDDRARADAQAKLDALTRAKDQVAASAGDPDALNTALGRLEDKFTELTGLPPGRRAGEMYAGRTLCVEETSRDLDITFGSGFVSAIARPLGIPLSIARWLCSALAERYLAELEKLHSELACDSVPLGQLWFLAQDIFYGTGERPAVEITAELRARWHALFDLSHADPAERALSFTSESLAARAAELFPAPGRAGPTWVGARIHCPDLQFRAGDAEAFRRGDYEVVLGEMHTAWPGLACAAAVASHPDPKRLAAAMYQDLSGRCVYQLLPASWPRHSPRLALALEDDRDVQFAFTAAPGADRDRLIPISSMLVERTATGLTALAADGRRWPLLEIFGRQLSEVAVEALKGVATAAHSPRITVDRLVMARETWRMTAGDCPVTHARGDAGEYLACRRWRAGLGLPERVFVKLSTEVKPVFIDLTSPVYAAVLAASLRSAYRADTECPLEITEMLPTPDEAWLTDAQGHHYVAELRLQVRDELALAEAHTKEQ